MTRTEDIKNAIDTLFSGGVILYPSDTIWALGCDATNDEAVKKVFKIKKRSDSKSMIILCNNANMLNAYIKEVPEVAWELIEVSDKPLTIIYPGAKNLSPSLIANDGSIGIRIVHDSFCEELLHKFRKPIVSTSANVSNANSPNNFDEIEDEIIKAANYVVKYRQEDRSQHSASSIIKLGLGGGIKIIR